MDEEITFNGHFQNLGAIQHHIIDVYNEKGDNTAGWVDPGWQPLIDLIQVGATTTANDTTEIWTDASDGTQYRIIPPPYPTVIVYPWRTPTDPTRCPELRLRKRGEICKLTNRVCIRNTDLDNRNTCAYYEDWIDSQKKQKEVKEVNDNEVPRELIDY